MDVSEKTPSVSIGIPTLNEQANIERVVSGFLSTAYPHLVEVLVADGGSTDDTRAIVERLRSRDPRVRLIDNPERIQAAGLNRAIREARGDVFLRADAHSIYADNYVETCVSVLLETGAMNVGGAQRFIAETPFQGAVGLVSQHTALGGGRVSYRDLSFEGWSDTISLGCFWRADLLEVNGFNLSATNEDIELNLRLRHLAERRGGDERRVCWTSRNIRTWYYPRRTLTTLFRQYIKYGRGRYVTQRQHGAARIPLRGRLPFYLLAFGTFVVLFDLAALHGRLGTPIVLALFVSALVVYGLMTAFRFRRAFVEEIWRGNAPPPSPWLIGVLCGVVLLTQPLAHALGYGMEMLSPGGAKVAEPAT